MRWPVGIAVGLAIVVLVDAFFIWAAVRNAPVVDQSYVEAQR